MFLRGVAEPQEWKQNACTIPCRHSRPSPCKESGAEHLSAHAAKTALRLWTAHYLPPSKNAASRRSLQGWKSQHITSVRVFARRGGAAGVEAKCLHDSVQAFATVALQRKRCGALVRSRRKTELRPWTTHYLPPSKNAASRRSLRDEKEEYITSDRVFARRGGAAGVEAKCLHGFVQALATVALRRRWCAGRDLNPHERTAH